MNLKHCLLLFICIVHISVNAQETDTLRKRNIYKPYRAESQDTIRKPGINEEETRQIIDSARVRFIRDSIFAREQFVRDSILARQIFVRDSLAKRKKMLDSLNFLRPELEKLLEAYSRAVEEDIVLKCLPIQIVGDSVLGDFVYHTLPFGAREPYCPWKTRLKVSGKPVKITLDKTGKQITAIHTSQFKASFTSGSNLRVIQQPAVIQKNSRGNFYRNPVDSVFFDRYGKIVKIKSYVLFHSLTADNQRGPLLFTNVIYVKQYQYDSKGLPSAYQLVRFTERWKAYEQNKVSSIIDYTIAKNGNNFKLTQKNDPPNQYAEGTYTFTFNDNEDLSGISFVNSANTESWERTIELNKDGNVSCYFDKRKGLIVQSLCMIYHPEPGAKYAVETITTTFEKDGISYLQRNNTTGKSRTRDRLTLEWSQWK